MEASAVPTPALAGVSGVRSAALLRLASDAHLVVLIRQGRAAAFEAIYNRHHRAILSFCRHMLGDREEAEDAVQHTFLAAYSDLISSEKPIHLRAWLFTIARNRCYSMLRARREHPAADLDEPLTEGLATQVQRRQDLKDLVLDMRRLPYEQRAALVLAELDCLSHEEIASVLGVPREKIKALVFQARESLVASRAARETDCAEIRQQLASLRGGALRRGNLRRHLRECSGCSDFRKDLERQRRGLAILMPVAPTIALKESVLGSTAGGSASVGVAGGGILVLKGAVVKSLIGAVIAAIGTAGTIVAAHGLHVVVPTRVSVSSGQSSSPLAAAAPSPEPGPAARERAAAARRVSGEASGATQSQKIVRARVSQGASSSAGAAGGAGGTGYRLPRLRTSAGAVTYSASKAILPSQHPAPPSGSPAPGGSPNVGADAHRPPVAGGGDHRDRMHQIGKGDKPGDGRVPLGRPRGGFPGPGDVPPGGDPGTGAGSGPNDQSGGDGQAVPGPGSQPPGPTGMPDPGGPGAGGAGGTDAGGNPPRASTQ